jgi:hypothetical protein
MHPTAQHLGAGGWQQTLLDQKCDDSRTEQLFQRFETDIGQAVEQPRAAGTALPKRVLAASARTGSPVQTP